MHATTSQGSRRSTRSCAAPAPRSSSPGSTDEEDNLRAALDRLLAEQPVDAARFGLLLASYWTARGRLVEGRTRFRALSELDGLSDELRGRVLQRLAEFAMWVNDFEECVPIAKESVELAEAAGDHVTVANALVMLGWAADRQHDAALAVSYGERAAAEAALSGDFRVAVRCAGELGVFLTGAGRLDDARSMLQTSIDGFRELGDRSNVAIERRQRRRDRLPTRRLRKRSRRLRGGDRDAANRPATVGSASSPA